MVEEGSVEDSADFLAGFGCWDSGEGPLGQDELDMGLLTFQSTYDVFSAALFIAEEKTALIRCGICGIESGWSWSQLLIVIKQSAAP